MNKTILLLFTAFLSLDVLSQVKTGSESTKNRTPKDTIDFSMANSQTESGTNYSQCFVPPSPHAASLGKYGAVPVGLFTGTIQLEIPLYEFRTKNFKYPISLKYASNGLMVDKVANWTGIDWMLEAGGIINRYQKGKYDKPGPRPFYPDWNSMSLEQRLGYLETSRTLPKDLEPDIFTFTFPGYSGKFIIDENGIPLPIPFSNIKIETSTTGSEYNRFTITTPDGVVYKFDEFALTSYPSELSRPNSWYLTKILHPEGDSITFTYDTVWLTQFFGLRRSVTVYLNGDLPWNGCPSCPASTISEITTPSIFGQVKYLCNIEFHGYGRINFQKTQNRLDSDDYKLDGITVVNPDGTVIKSFSFYYGFPVNNPNFQSPTVIGNGPSNNFKYRMFLDSLQLKDNNNRRVSSYLFEYYDLNLLPSRFSYSQDHLNYFNGKSNNDLLQLNKVPIQYSGLFSNFVGGACNRSPDPQFARVGMLKRITYPTKGFTSIEYEGHINAFGLQLGGCRVLRTIDVNGINISAEIRKYIYEQGISVSDSVYYRQFPIGIGCENNPLMRLSCHYGILSSNSIYNMNYADNLNICYGKVVVLHGDNAESGKEVHYFKTQMDATGTPINGMQIRPLVYSNTGWMNGTLTKTEILKTGETLIHTKNITPFFDEPRNLKTVKCMAINYRYTGPWVASSEILSFYDVVSYELKSVWAYTLKEEIIKHEASGNISTSTTFGYNNANHCMISTEQTKNSDGRITLSKFFYPDDYLSDIQNFSILKNKYMIGKLIDTRTYTDGKIVAGKQYKYNDFGQVTDFYLAEPSYSITDIAFSQTSPYSFVHQASYSFYPDNTLKQVLPTNCYPTSYLWDNTGVYLMATVKGATATMIEMHNGKDCTFNSLEMYNLLKPIVPMNCMVYTNSYKRHIGIERSTNPTGISINYKYDDYGRLKWIKNHEGHLLQKFEYNYASH